MKSKGKDANTKQILYVNEPDSCGVGRWLDSQNVIMKTSSSRGVNSN